MHELTLQEKNAMLALWKTGNGSPSQILEHHTEPKPHKNTLNSTLKNLETKGLVTYEIIGNSYNYRPLLDKEQFSETFLERFVKEFFDDSYKELALFFTAKKKLSKKEFEGLFNIIREKKTR
jgi:BlaI family penicillinase repressor